MVRSDAPQVDKTSSQSIVSLAIVGNMIGDGTDKLPSWVSEEEANPFLYHSDEKKVRLGVYVAAGAVVLFAVLRGALGSDWAHFLPRANEAQGPPGPPETSASLVAVDSVDLAHHATLRMLWTLSSVGILGLLPMYLLGAQYYFCADALVRTSAAYLEGSPVLECLVSVAWCAHLALGSVLIGRLPKPRREIQADTPEPECTPALTPSDPTSGDRRQRGLPTVVGRTLCWFVWILVVSALASPSIVYAISGTLPKHNSLFSWRHGWVLLWIAHRTTALVMLAIDTLVTPKLAGGFAKMTGLREDMLLMAARMGTMWVVAAGTTILLHENCYGGWRWFWLVCTPGSPEEAKFRLTFGPQTIIDPATDLCPPRQGWWRQGRCSRSLIESLGPLFMEKLALRAFLQPVTTLVTFMASQKDDAKGELYIEVKGKRVRTCGSLELQNQYALLVTLVEMGLLWGALVPLLLPLVWISVATNLLVFRAGVFHFGARPPVAHSFKRVGWYVWEFSDS